MPCDGRTPVVADDDKLLVAQSISEANDVIRQFNDVVGFDRLGPVAATVATLVGHGDLEPSFHQRVDLVAPEVPALRETVQQNDQRTFAFDHGA